MKSDEIKSVYQLEEVTDAISKFYNYSVPKGLEVLVPLNNELRESILNQIFAYNKREAEMSRIILDSFMTHTGIIVKFKKQGG